MNITKIVLACAFGLVLARPVYANTIEVLGAGNQSCGDWTQAEQNSDQFGANEMLEWVLGYVVGIESVASGLRNKNFTLTTDTNGVSGWLDNYCKTNPTQSLSDAANQFLSSINPIQPAP